VGVYAAAGKDYEVESEALHALIQAHRPGAASVEARTRLPGVPLFEGDMRSFELDRRFDAVTCLFSAIADMQSSARSMASSIRSRSTG